MSMTIISFTTRIYLVILKLLHVSINYLFEEEWAVNLGACKLMSHKSNYYSNEATGTLTGFLRVNYKV